MRKILFKWRYSSDGCCCSTIPSPLVQFAHFCFLRWRFARGSNWEMLSLLLQTLAWSEVQISKPVGFWHREQHRSKLVVQESFPDLWNMQSNQTYYFRFGSLQTLSWFLHSAFQPARNKLAGDVYLRSTFSSMMPAAWKYAAHPVDLHVKRLSEPLPGIVCNGKLRIDHF